MYTRLTRLKRCVWVLWCSVIRLSEYVTGTYLCYLLCKISWFSTVIIPVRLLLLWSLRSKVQAVTMAFGQLIFSPALNFHLLCFCSSSISIVKVGALWGIIYWPGSLDTAGSNLKTPFLRKLDLRCPCRVPYLDSWHITNTQTKWFLSTHWLYLSNGAASFNPSWLENTLSGNIHPQPGPLLLTCYQHWQMQISVLQAT